MQTYVRRPDYSEPATHRHPIARRGPDQGEEEARPQGEGARARGAGDAGAPRGGGARRRSRRLGAQAAPGTGGVRWLVSILSSDIDVMLVRQALMAKIKDRARRKAALTDRKSAAAQARMKNIASLAADDRVPKAKKRKGGGGALACRSFVTCLILFIFWYRGHVRRR
jgi:hypothetical protein